MADLGTVSFLIDIQGQPLVKELARDFDTVTVSEKKVSDATQRVMADFQRMKSIMQMVKTETDGAANSFQRFSVKELQQAAQRMQGFESVLANTRRGMGQMGMATQQVGYQVGDFLVQVQSGTNWMVAFGQQATQLVGILPSFAGKLGMSVGSLIGISTGLGIAIPLITAIGAAFMRTSEASKEAVNQIKSNMNSLQSTIEKMHLDNIKVGFKIDEDSVARVKEDMIKANMELLQLQSSIPPPQAGGFAGAIQAKNAMAEQARLLKEQLSGQQELLDKLDAEKEAKRMLAGQGSAAVAVQRQLVANKTEELRVIQETKKYIFEQLGIYLNIGKTIDGISKADIKSVFSDAISSSGAMYQFVKNTYDTMAKMVGMAEASQRTDYYKLGTLNEGMAGRAGGKGQGEKRDYSLPKGVSGTDTGTGGGGGVDKVQALLDSLQTQTEVTDAWYEESQKTLQSASDKELEILGGKEEAKLRLLNDYRQKQYEAQQAQSQLLYQSQAGMYSALGDLLSQFGTKSKGAAVAALAIQKGLSIAQIIANTAAAQMRALAELGPIAGSAMAAKIGLMGKLQVGLVAATGLMQAGSIMSGGASGSSGSGNGHNSVGTSANNMQTAAPQVVMIQGLKPTDVFTGEQLSTLFDSLYKENRNRGMVFQVAR